MWIIGAITLKSIAPEKAMPILAQFVVVGFIGQWLITSILVRKKGLGFKKDVFKFQIPPEVKKLLKSFSLCAIGVGAIQINSFLDALFANYADPKGPIYLWYSIRMQQLALAILAIACINTIVPRLSRAIKKGDSKEITSYYCFSIHRIFLLMIPCTIAIIALGPCSCALLWGREAYSTIGISKTTLSLWAYGLGMLPSALIILLSSISYAYDNFRLPTIGSIASVIINVFLNSLFILYFDFGIASIALATSISAWINLYILLKLSHFIEIPFPINIKKVLDTLGHYLFAFFITVLFDSIAFTPTILPLITTGQAMFSHSAGTQIITFFSHLTCFIGSVVFTSSLFKNNDIFEIFNIFFSFSSKKNI